MRRVGSWCCVALALMGLLLEGCGQNQSLIGFSGVSDDGGSKTGDTTPIPISGPDKDFAIDHLEDLPFAEALDEDFVYNAKVGITHSRRQLIVTLEETATVGEANDAIIGSGGTLSGVVASAGVLQLDVGHGDTFDAMNSALGVLDKHPAITGAAPDMLLYPNIVPRHMETYFWGRPNGSKWGLEFIRAPLAWNLNRRIERAMQQAERQAPVVAIVDTGFQRHADLAPLSITSPYDPTSILTPSHGTFVAGIAGATWGNQASIDGVSPFVGLHLVTATPTIATWGQVIDKLGITLDTLVPNPRVVNMSLAYNWHRICHGDDASGLEKRCDPRISGRIPDAGCDATTVTTLIATHALSFMRIVNAANSNGKRRLFVTAAGNDSGPMLEPGQNWCTNNKLPSGMGNFPAFFASPMNAAALFTDVEPNMIVVEALGLNRTTADAWDAVRSQFSNIAGDVFAPGEDITSLGAWGSEGLQFDDGTSAAAPYVTGAAAFLLAIEPDLTNAELKTLLTQAPYASPQAGGGSSTSTHLNLYFAAAGIDRIRPTREPKILKWLADFDDGTADGFQRVVYGMFGQELGQDTTDAHWDDKVDLRDFRRLRDAYLMMNGFALDGADDNEKRDLNEDYFIDGDFSITVSGGLESFPRVALDDDEVVNILHERRFLEQTDISDVDVFAQVYAYEDDAIQRWPKEALPRLMRSADLIVYGGPAQVTLEGDPEELVPPLVPEDLSPLRELIIPESATVLTTPLLRNVHIRWRQVVDGVPGSEVDQTLAVDLTPGENRVVRLERPCEQGCSTMNTRMCCSTNQCVIAWQCESSAQRIGGCECCLVWGDSYGLDPVCYACGEFQNVFSANCPGG